MVPCVIPYCFVARTRSIHVQEPNTRHTQLMISLVLLSTLLRVLHMLYVLASTTIVMISTIGFAMLWESESHTFGTFLVSTSSTLSCQSASSPNWLRWEL